MQRYLVALFLALVAAPQLAAGVNVDQKQKRSPSDISAQVAAQTQENIQIHDVWSGQEEQDIDAEKKVKANKDLSAFLQKDASDRDILATGKKST